MAESPLRDLFATQQVELIALDPDPGAPGEERFHGYAVLGRELTDHAGVTAEMLALGVERSDGTRARCFMPRHGFRFISQGATHELLLCLQCLTLRRIDGDQIENWSFDIRDAAQLNAQFTAAGLEIHP